MVEEEGLEPSISYEPSILSAVRIPNSAIPRDIMRLVNEQPQSRYIATQIYKNNAS